MLWALYRVTPAAWLIFQCQWAVPASPVMLAAWITSLPEGPTAHGGIGPFPRAEGFPPFLCLGALHEAVADEPTARASPAMQGEAGTPSSSRFNWET